MAGCAADFGRMGAGFGMFRPGCMLKVFVCFCSSGAAAVVGSLFPWCDSFLVMWFLLSYSSCRSLGAYFGRRGVFAIVRWCR